MSKYEYRKRDVYAGVVIDIKAHSEEELNIKYAKKIANIEKGQITTGGSTSVNRWTEHFFDTYVAEKVSDGVLLDRKYMYRKHIRPYIGSMRIMDVNTGHCQNIINKMNGMSKDRIDKGCQLLYNIFKRARAEKLIYENPAEDLVRPTAKDGQGRPATMQERTMMLMVAKQHHAGLWVKAMLFCGFRPGETDRFLSKHINYDAGLIFIDGTKSAAAKRIVPAPSELLEEFKALNRSPNEYIFQNAYGDKMRKSSRAKLWNSFKREMNILAGCKVYRNQLQEPYMIADDLIPYCCRHTFATDLKDANIPYRIRQELLGHSKSSVTDTYTHRTESSLKTGTELLWKFRQEQAKEIYAMEERIKTIGYKTSEKFTEDLTHKYFPDLF